tara:strand:- start:7592 stop:8218 length:627 start_codon:yes stop_codon:yes gene_type:complete
MFKRALLVASLIFASSANAELVSYDWLTEGDGDVTLDTNTGKLWLDLDVTSDTRWSVINHYIENDARYSGWRFATADEVMTLANNIFPEDGAATTSINEQLNEHRMMGFSYEWNTGHYTGGFYVNGDVFSTFYSNYSGSIQKAGGTGVSSTSNPKSVFYGFYLVSDDANVSIDSDDLEIQMSANDVPVYGGSIALALFGLFFSRNKPR